VTGGPLAGLLAVAMIGVVCFHAGRLVLAVRLRRPTEADVDVVHAAMGVSMAGMLTGWLTGSWNDVWTVAFAASSVWFGLRLVRGVSGSGLGGPLASHHLPHFVASAVMLSMLWAMRWEPAAGGQPGSTGAGSPMAHMAGGGVLLPAVLAVLVVANSAVAVWSALPASPGTAGPASTGASAAPRAARSAGVLSDRGAQACFVVMGLAMAYMVVAAHP
jgi:hypothetical protein